MSFVDNHDLSGHDTQVIEFHLFYDITGKKQKENAKCRSCTQSSEIIRFIKTGFFPHFLHLYVSPALISKIGRRLSIFVYNNNDIIEFTFGRQMS